MWCLELRVSEGLNSYTAHANYLREASGGGWREQETVCGDALQYSIVVRYILLHFACSANDMSCVIRHYFCVVARHTTVLLWCNDLVGLPLHLYNSRVVVLCDKILSVLGSITRTLYRTLCSKDEDGRGGNNSRRDENLDGSVFFGVAAFVVVELCSPSCCGALYCTRRAKGELNLKRDKG